MKVKTFLQTLAMVATIVTTLVVAEISESTTIAYLLGVFAALLSILIAYFMYSNK